MTNITIPVTLAHIVNGDDTGMPVAKLYWTHSVTYELESAAAALFKFKPAAEAITLNANDCCMMKHLDVHRDDSRLKLTIKDKSETWSNGKATLFFDAKGATKPAPNGLDPILDNNGVPK